MVIAKTLEIEQNFKRRQGPILKQIPRNKLKSKMTQQIRKHHESEDQSSV